MFVLAVCGVLACSVDHAGLLQPADGGGVDSPPSGACNEADRRECGNTVGACEAGEQRCEGGTWGQCIAATLPAPEMCNGEDDDCDGVADDGLLMTFYADVDGDSAGDPSSSLEACEPPSEYVSVAGDCDDLDERSYEGNAEVCDTVDNDCDGRKDEEACDAPNCSTHEFEDHVYLFCASRLTWNRAQDVCRELGGGRYYGLIIVEDAAEDTFVGNTIAALGDGEGAWWLGLNDQEAENTFIWGNGATTAYRGWADEQPTNRGSRDCIQTRAAGAPAGWSVLSCERSNYFVCEQLPR